MPHLIWLIQNNFPPLKWVGARRAVQVRLAGSVHFCPIQSAPASYASVALLLWWLGTRPSGLAIKDLAVAIRCHPPSSGLFVLAADGGADLRRGGETHATRLALEYSGAQSFAGHAAQLGQDRFATLQREGDGDRGAVRSARIDLQSRRALLISRYATAPRITLLFGLAGDAAAAEWRAKTTAPLRISCGPIRFGCDRDGLHAGASDRLFGLFQVSLARG